MLVSRWSYVLDGALIAYAEEQNRLPAGTADCAASMWHDFAPSHWFTARRLCYEVLVSGLLPTVCLQATISILTFRTYT